MRPQPSLNGDTAWRMGWRSRRGFTLLEVLVVVAIIALLVAVLLPSLQRARDETRRVTCASNLHQLNLAWATYLNTYGGQFPTGMNMEYNYGGLQGQGSAFFGSDPAHPLPKPLNRQLKLDPVLRNGGNVFRCPLDAGTSFVRPTAIGYYGTSYFPNQLLVGRNIWVPYGRPCEAQWTELAGNPWALPPKPGLLDNLKRDQIDNPTTLILIGDYAWLDNWDETVADQFPYWHQRKSTHNFSFMDGHGDFVRIRKGIHVDPSYTIIPFRNLREQCLSCQQEVGCP